MRYSKELLELLLEEVEAKKYLQIRNSELTKEGYTVLKERYPDAVMVSCGDFVYLACTDRGKEEIRTRLQSQLEKEMEKVKELQSCINRLEEKNGEGKESKKADVGTKEDNGGSRIEMGELECKRGGQPFSDGYQ